MADFLSKIRIPRATEHFTKLNLSCAHVTTQDPFKIKPIYSRIMVPGQSINVDLSHTVRLAPLKKPFYGPMQIINRAFFVPCRTIQQGWNEFITDTTYSNNVFSGKINSCPRITSRAILDIVTQPQYVTTVTGSGANDLAVTIDGNTTRYKFTALGKYLVDVLRCLGYQIDANAVRESVVLNAMPLLAFIKIYVDWFRNTNFAFNSSLDRLLCTYNTTFTKDSFGSLLNEVLYASYENDYFTSSWSNPSSPDFDIQSNVTINDPSVTATSEGNRIIVSNRGSSSVNYYRTPVIGGVGSSGEVTGTVPPYQISTYILTALQSLSDYMRRHQISGYRAIDRFRSRFGITLPDAALNRSNYLGKSVSPIQITDVTSTSDTSGAVLGQYSGFGISRDASGKFNFKTDEYGYFMILSIIVPLRAQYRNGVDRHLLDVDKLDFYTPEFDGLGVQAIANMEVKGDYVATPTNEPSPSGTWAFIPRYAHYKCSRDFLTGDFRFPTSSANLESFHTFRDFQYLPAHNVAFCTGNPSEYDKVFNDSQIMEDHFFSSFVFNIHSSAPMSPLFENYHFDESGAPVEQKIGGTKLT